MSTVTVETERTFTIVLNDEEAGALKALCGHISGHPDTSARGVFSGRSGSLWDQLREYKLPRPVVSGSITFGTID